MYVLGPDHMSLVLSPRLGVKVTQWSLVPGEPLQGVTFNGRPTYFVYYSYASDPEPYQFWVDFQVSNIGDMFIINCISTINHVFMYQSILSISRQVQSL